MVPLLSGNLMITGFHWPGTPQDRESESDVLEVGPEFFSTMQIPFLAGRVFDASDYKLVANKSASAAVAKPVNRGPNVRHKVPRQREPIGKTLRPIPRERE